MYSKVKPLRERGKRKTDRDIQATIPSEGDLSLGMCAGVYELKLSDRNDSQLKPALPILYHAQLVSMHGNRMLFRGIEQSQDGTEVAQEWSVLIG